MPRKMSKIDWGRFASVHKTIEKLIKKKTGVSGNFLGKTRLKQAEGLRKQILGSKGGFHLIVGDPGNGKSAMMAQLHSEIKASIPYFFSLDHIAREDIHSPMTVYCVLAKAIAERCKTPDRSKNASGEESAAEALKYAFSDAAEKFGGHGAPKGVVLLIDGLEENPHFDSIWKVLSCAERGIVVVMAAQPKVIEKEFKRVEERSPFKLPPLSPDDCMQILQGGLKAKYPEEYLARIAKASKGNALYIAKMIEEMNDSPRRFVNVKRPPNGLKAYFSQRWENLSGNSKKILSVLAHTLGPIDIDSLSDILEMEDSATLKGLLMAEAGRFAIESGGLCRLNHFAWKDQITRHSPKGEKMLLRWCSQWVEHKREYALAFYPRHLHKANDAKSQQELRECMTGKFFEVKLQHFTEKKLGLTQIQNDLLLAATAAATKGVVSAMTVIERRYKQVSEAIAREDVIEMIRNGREAQALHAARQRPDVEQRGPHLALIALLSKDKDIVASALAHLRHLQNLELRPWLAKTLELIKFAQTSEHAEIDTKSLEMGSKLIPTVKEQAITTYRSFLHPTTTLPNYPGIGTILFPKTQLRKLFPYLSPRSAIRLALTMNLPDAALISRVKSLIRDVNDKLAKPSNPDTPSFVQMMKSHPINEITSTIISCISKDRKNAAHLLEDEVESKIPSEEFFQGKLDLYKMCEALIILGRKKEAIPLVEALPKKNLKRKEAPLNFPKTLYNRPIDRHLLRIIPGPAGTRLRAISLRANNSANKLATIWAMVLAGDENAWDELKKTYEDPGVIRNAQFGLFPPSMVFGDSEVIIKRIAQKVGDYATTHPFKDEFLTSVGKQMLNSNAFSAAKELATFIGDYNVKKEFLYRIACRMGRATRNTSARLLYEELKNEKKWPKAPKLDGTIRMLLADLCARTNDVKSMQHELNRWVTRKDLPSTSYSISDYSKSVTIGLSRRELFSLALETVRNSKENPILALAFMARETKEARKATFTDLLNQELIEKLREALSAESVPFFASAIADILIVWPKGKNTKEVDLLTRDLYTTLHAWESRKKRHVTLNIWMKVGDLLKECDKDLFEECRALILRRSDPIEGKEQADVFSWLTNNDLGDIIREKIAELEPGDRFAFFLESKDKGSAKKMLTAALDLEGDEEIEIEYFVDSIIELDDKSLLKQMADQGDRISAHEIPSLICALLKSRIHVAKSLWDRIPSQLFHTKMLRLLEQAIKLQSLPSPQNKAIDIFKNLVDKFTGARYRDLAGDDATFITGAFASDIMEELYPILPKDRFIRLLWPSPGEPGVLGWDNSKEILLDALKNVPDKETWAWIKESFPEFLAFGNTKAINWVIENHATEACLKELKNKISES